MTAGIDAAQAWRASFVRRWHANPDLAGSGDTIGWHSGRVALLILALFPRHATGAMLSAALCHDLGEAGVGDVSATAKGADPVLGLALERAEAASRAAMGIEDPVLSMRELAILAFCDRLDAFLWMRHAMPHLEARPDWIRDRRALLDVAETLGVSLADLGVAP